MRPWGGNFATKGSIAFFLREINIDGTGRGAKILSMAVHLKEKALVDFAHRAAAVADKVMTETIGLIDNAAFIFQKTGLDLTGFTRLIDNYGIRHTLKQHGNPAKEAGRGQLAVTLDDFGLIPLITSQPDHVFLDGKNKIGREVIVFVKLIDGIGYWHAEEIRAGRKLVATDSMRKKKGAWSAL